jgi:hypothetical protein
VTAGVTRYLIEFCQPREGWEDEDGENLDAIDFSGFFLRRNSSMYK